MDVKKKQKLNRDKCQFGKTEIQYFGHIIGKDGIKPKPQRVRDISELSSPTNVMELRQRIGMINYFGRFLPDRSSVMHPINCLLKKDAALVWGETQEQAFNQVKAMLTSAPGLAYYDATKPTVVSADASRWSGCCSVSGTAAWISDEAASTSPAAHRIDTGPPGSAETSRSGSVEERCVKRPLSDRKHECAAFKCLLSNTSEYKQYILWKCKRNADAAAHCAYEGATDQLDQTFSV
ncbi:hypothetical protein F2P81_001320 [Scophthalmus maximus]|uniref:Reverse transcriptase/retrotransposon-derived protein RNase H-like domain-containing protein n=1 Tax=Scophthalmus maximus TaxID=52904 RepID=A0A6A4TLF2_SCOMX|nr:hypothetical protein F2P81_001320 [Scophthalmus maximus]